MDTQGENGEGHVSKYMVRGHRDEEGYFLTFAGFPEATARLVSRDQSTAEEMARHVLALTTGALLYEIDFDLDWGFDGVGLSA